MYQMSELTTSGSVQDRRKNIHMYVYHDSLTLVYWYLVSLVPL